jgi:hypothetical protein
VRLLALVLFGLPLAVATIVEARRGNPFAIGIALGLIGPTVYFATVALLTRILAPLAPESLPRKADPAKIARLERDLGMATTPERREGPQEGATAWEGDRLLVYRRGHWVQAQANVVDAEGPTTVQRGPTNANPATSHGAPTFGHKIEGP